MSDLPELPVKDADHYTIQCSCGRRYNMLRPAVGEKVIGSCPGCPGHVIIDRTETGGTVAAAAAVAEEASEAKYPSTDLNWLLAPRDPGDSER